MPLNKELKNIKKIYIYHAMTSHLSLSTMQLSILVEQEDQKESKPLSSKINMLCWNSLSFTFLYFPSLSFTLLHSLRFSSLSFTLLHSPSLFFTLLHFSSLSITFFFTLLRSPSLSFPFLRFFHSPSLVFTLLHSPSEISRSMTSET